VKEILEITGPGMWMDTVMDGMNSDAKIRGGNKSDGYLTSGGALRAVEFEIFTFYIVSLNQQLYVLSD